jgi:predicted TIM-barrel fold metal-dependent hydrolase
VYEPLWEALEEIDLAFALHPAGLADMPGASRDMGYLMAPGTHHALILQFDQQMTLSNLVYGGVLERHPGLKVAVLECGGGWIAHWMDRMNEFLESYHWAAAPLTMEPSDYFRRQCWISFDPGERTASVLGELAGADRFIWASDFPHSDAKYPGVVDELREHNDAMADGPRKGLYGLNALDLYGIPHPAAA